MSDIEKRRSIKDPVWGNIELFPWEVRLINHFLFDRLHHIVQNSSAFKVYPGLKYSRFLHTIGVTHVATQLFLNAASNSETKAQNALKEEVKAISDIIDSKARINIEACVCRNLACLPDCGILLAAIRVAALTHDIGHLPYSHVFENAIDEFTQGDFESVIPVSTEAKQQRASLITEISSQRNENAEDTKLHELLGKRFLEVLRWSFADDAEIRGLLAAAELILHDNGMPIAHGFIASTIDADRIDFVRRDGLFSGLFTSSVDFGRLFWSYELAFDKDKNIWLPRPSNRAVSEKEKLLMERFQDYRYIVVHHRVHLYDEIMGNILLRLMASGRLADFMATLSQLLAFHVEHRQNLHDMKNRVAMLQRLLTQFDDPWVEVEIRKQYTSDIHLDETERFLFNAYVEERQSFVSGFKTDEDFFNMCGNYAPNLLRTEPNTVREALASAKHVLQADLSKRLKRTVLIGSTDKKLNYGIRDSSTAQFFGVLELREFLLQKKVRSLTFNVWYESKETDSDKRAVEHQEVMRIILNYLQENVTGQLEMTKLTGSPAKPITKGLN